MDFSRLPRRRFLRFLFFAGTCAGLQRLPSVVPHFFASFFAVIALPKHSVSKKHLLRFEGELVPNACSAKSLGAAWTPQCGFASRYFRAAISKSAPAGIITGPFGPTTSTICLVTQRCLTSPSWMITVQVRPSANRVMIATAVGKLVQLALFEQPIFKRHALGENLGVFLLKSDCVFMAIVTLRYVVHWTRPAPTCRPRSEPTFNIVSPYQPTHADAVRNQRPRRQSGVEFVLLQPSSRAASRAE